jgi:hypothetical protein
MKTLCFTMTLKRNTMHADALREEWAEIDDANEKARKL